MDFSNAQVPWPPLLANLFLFFSAFNLNIEIVAPECFIQSVTFVNKFKAMIAVPLLLYAALASFAQLTAGYRRLIAGQTKLSTLIADAPAMASGGLLLLYLFYLYVAKTTMGHLHLRAHSAQRRQPVPHQRRRGGLRVRRPWQRSLPSSSTCWASLPPLPTCCTGTRRQ